MSHLFSQGAVSADLLAVSRDFRERAMEEILGAESDKVGKKKVANLLEAYQLSMQPRSLPGVIESCSPSWTGDGMEDLSRKGISFFSRVNFRRTLEDVRALRYEVAVSRIQLRLP